MVNIILGGKSAVLFFNQFNKYCASFWARVAVPALEDWASYTQGFASDTIYRVCMCLWCLFLLPMEIKVQELISADILTPAIIVSSKPHLYCPDLMF